MAMRSDSLWTRPPTYKRKRALYEIKSDLQ